MLQRQIAEFLRAQGIAAETRLVVGVSGGPDSLALLHALAQAQPRERLTAAHLNHGWRDSAESEAHFVQQLAQTWGITGRIGRADTRRLAVASRQSLEAAARQARYDFLAQVALDVGAQHIVVGHQADDQAETILMHLLRGAGLTGLRGMLPVAPTPGHPELTLLRPLLEITRQTILAYLSEQHLAALEDASNADPTFLRNRVRAELLPGLAQYNPQISRHLRQLGALAAGEEELLGFSAETSWSACLAAQGEGWCVLRRAVWQELPLALRRRVLRRAAQSAQPATTDLDFEAIERARRLAESGPTGGQAPLPGRLLLTVGYAELWVATAGTLPPGRAPQLLGVQPVLLPTPGRLALADGWMLTAQRREDVSWLEAAENDDPWQATVAWPSEPLLARPRRPGERMQPLGLGGHSTRLKEMMIDRKIPAGLRALWPVVATAERVVWLAGQAVDERSRVSAESGPALHLHCFRPNPVDASPNG